MSSRTSTTSAGEQASILFRDHLGSIRGIFDEAANDETRPSYTPYGVVEKNPTADQTTDETKGWLGERFDAGAGLQYLNARYYDPELALFIQPDWFEVTMQGVGTNRYAYSFNDPVNFSDPNGNCGPCAAVGPMMIGAAIGISIDEFAAIITGEEVTGMDRMTSGVVGALSFGVGNLARLAITMVKVSKKFKHAKKAVAITTEVAVGAGTGSVASQAYRNGEVDGATVAGAVVAGVVAGRVMNTVSATPIAQKIGQKTADTVSEIFDNITTKTAQNVGRKAGSQLKAVGNDFAKGMVKEGVEASIPDTAGSGDFGGGEAGTGDVSNE